jgi:hypothetical protein
MNSLKQISLANQLSITNIPEQLEKEQIIKELFLWCNLPWSDDAVKRASFVKKKSKPSRLFIEFSDVRLRQTMMNFARNQQKSDAGGKLVPILTENVFKSVASTPSKGMQLKFQNVMTELNRRMGQQNEFDKIWLINEGSISVKYSCDSRPIKLLSIEHLSDVIKNSKT